MTGYVWNYVWKPFSPFEKSSDRLRLETHLRNQSHRCGTAISIVSMACASRWHMEMLRSLQFMFTWARSSSQKMSKRSLATNTMKVKPAARLVRLLLGVDINVDI